VLPDDDADVEPPVFCGVDDAVVPDVGDVDEDSDNDVVDVSDEEDDNEVVGEDESELVG